ncbi:MAG: phosphotransferase [Muribaculaceae bacterium]|nr:phosphotransferase [Muribaculaceae bacterium]
MGTVDAPGAASRRLYESRFGGSASVVAVNGGGSGRRYYRLSCEGLPTVVATEGECPEENRAFVMLSRKLRDAGHNVPEIYAVSDCFSCYLQEDLGDIPLLSLLSTDCRHSLSEKTLHSLVMLQTESESLWSGVVMARPFSRRQVMWDLNYFKYEFLKPCGLLFDEERLEDDFEAFAIRLLEGDSRLWGFMYRDFQSRNVMVREGEPWWIDYQGGRKGPMVYDAVSFLWQARARFTDEERAVLMSSYAAALSVRTGVPEGVILQQAGKFALFRTLQVLGAYGLRGLVERKAHFLVSIPDALSNLASLIEKGELDSYPELRSACEAACSSRYAARGIREGLNVTVYSFSYKMGYPEDLSGNGGGFMFDCRGMHNPGRYDRYHSLTGLDGDVAEFLEERGEVQEFVAKALEIVTPSVARYIQRGFNSLQVGFGCTGGQHRSVYCAQSFGERLARMYPGISVEIIHREQGKAYIL